MLIYIYTYINIHIHHTSQETCLGCPEDCLSSAPVCCSIYIYIYINVMCVLQYIYILMIYIYIYIHINVMCVLQYCGNGLCDEYAGENCKTCPQVLTV